MRYEQHSGGDGVSVAALCNTYRYTLRSVQANRSLWSGLMVYMGITLYSIRVAKNPARERERVKRNAVFGAICVAVFQR